MKKTIHITVLSALIFVLWLPLARGADDVHGLIISIDGLRGDWSAHPDGHGLKIPNLRKLAERGTHANAVRGIFPTVTYPSHTTLITGCRPARHGILANTVFDFEKFRPTEAWHWDYKSIRVPTIIDAAHEAGWSTAAVSWPVTVGAPADVLFPEVWELGKFDDAFLEMYRNSRPVDLLPAVLTKYDLGAGMGRDASYTNIGKYIAERYRPRLMLVHLVDLDHDEHQFGPESPEAHETVEKCDKHVGELVAQYEKLGLLPKTVVAVVSDHGFLPTEKSFHVNAALREKGLIRSTDSGDEYDASGWISGGVCAIVLKKPDDAAALDRVREALAPYVGKPDSPIRRIFEREEIEQLGANPRAALMLDAGEGYTFGSHNKGEVVTDSTRSRNPVRGMHGQYPDRPNMEATFIAAGPGIAVGATVNEMQMIDVGPTLAAALGLTLPKAEGHSVPAVLATTASSEPSAKSSSGK